ncbi:MAG: biotin--[acetyl-CoA-carboxylase] ligase [Pseudomonadota bacterium]
MAGRLPSGAAIRAFETIDSTSLEAKRCVAAGEGGPLWITAGRQTAGYGRRGAAWRQSEGDIAASFLFSTPAPADRIGQLSYVAGLAAAAAIARFARDDTAVALKWPNDVLLGGGKVAGLLLELATTTDEARVIIFGLGVNIVSKPEIEDYETARLVDRVAGDPPGVEEFIAVVDAQFEALHRLWLEQGFAPIREAWTAQATGIGAPATARLPDRTITGVFTGVDDAGALVLETETGVETIAAGAVFFPPKR